MNPPQWAVVGGMLMLGFLLVFQLRRSEIRIVRQLADRYRFHNLNVLERWTLRRLVREGAATLVDEGRHAFIPDGYESFRSRRRRRTALMMGLLLVAAVVAAVSRASSGG